MHFKFPILALFAVFASSALAAPTGSDFTFSKSLPDLPDAPPPAGLTEREELQQLIGQVSQILVGSSRRNMDTIDDFLEELPEFQGELAEIRSKFEDIQSDAGSALTGLMNSLNQPSANLDEVRSTLTSRMTEFNQRLKEASDVLDAVAAESSAKRSAGKM